jgi:hypothetical protein
MKSASKLRYSGELNNASNPGEGISSELPAIKQHQSDNVNGGLGMTRFVGRDQRNAAMGTHRFRNVLMASREPTGTLQGIHPGAFVLCPVGPGLAFTAQEAGWQQQVYHLAFEQAQAAAHRPSPLEGNGIGVWN